MEKQTGELAGEVQWVECVADCSWSLSTAPMQFAHDCGNSSISGERQSACRSRNCLMPKWNFVYFPRGSGPAPRIALHRFKPLHGSGSEYPSSYLKSPHSPIQTLPTKPYSCWICHRQIFATQAIFNRSSCLHETKEKFPCPGPMLTFRNLPSPWFRCVRHGLHLWMWLWSSIAGK